MVPTSAWFPIFVLSFTLFPVAATCMVSLLSRLATTKDFLIRPERVVTSSELLGRDEDPHPTHCYVGTAEITGTVAISLVVLCGTRSCPLIDETCRTTSFLTSTNILEIVLFRVLELFPLILRRVVSNYIFFVT